MKPSKSYKKNNKNRNISTFLSVAISIIIIVAALGLVFCGGSIGRFTIIFFLGMTFVCLIMMASFGIENKKERHRARNKQKLGYKQEIVNKFKNANTINDFTTKKVHKVHSVSYRNYNWKIENKNSLNTIKNIKPKNDKASKNIFSKEEIKRDLQNRIDILKRYSYMEKKPEHVEENIELVDNNLSYVESEPTIEFTTKYDELETAQFTNLESAESYTNRFENKTLFPYEEDFSVGENEEDFSVEEETLDENKPMMKNIFEEIIPTIISTTNVDKIGNSNKISNSNETSSIDSSYSYPSTNLLQRNVTSEINNTISDEAEINAKKLIDTLESFGVRAKVINISRGPSVTRYEIQPDYGVKVSKIVGLTDDIALNLAATGVRMEAPIPGKAAVGIEIPNKEVKPVLLRDVVETDEFNNHSSKVAFAVGKDIAGNVIIADISKMPHLLIAGATGSGKSVCINTLIASILFKASPQEVKLLMIDPKVVELGVYNGIPHLLIPVVTDPKKAAGALNWAVQEMLNRYKLFADNNVRDLKGFNLLQKDKIDAQILPQIVIIIDELADLMMAAPDDVEDSICRLAQMARAAGMHLVIATQRPSVDVITGVIKANIPSRISFAVSSQIDSRTILDMAGAEKLVGRGDMLFNPMGRPKPLRVQGALVNDMEVEAIVNYIKSIAIPQYDQEVIEKIDNNSDTLKADVQEEDDLLPQVIAMVVEQEQASTSYIQRKFKLGYSRAARILDQIEARGIVGPFEGSKPRKVLISKQEWQDLYQ